MSDITINSDGELSEANYAQLGEELGLGEIIESAAPEATQDSPAKEIPESEPVEEVEAEAAVEPERPKASEILNLARREKALREKEKNVQDQIAEAKKSIRDEVLAELRAQATRDPAGFYGELGLEGQRGTIAQDLWHAELPEEDQSPEYKQKRMIQNMAQEIAELRNLVQENDPQKHIQKANEEAQYNMYMTELSSAANNSAAISTVFGEAAPQALWETASRIYKTTNVVPSASEVTEALEKELAANYNSLHGIYGATSKTETPQATSTKSAETISTSDTPRTRRRRGWSEEDILAEAEEIANQFIGAK